MRFLHHIAVILAGLLSVDGATAVYAQRQWGGDDAANLARYRVETWSVDEGLLQNDITSILQTRDGYLWLGTDDGLVRFDGSRFRVFDRHSSSIPTNRVSALHEDRGGNLWIGTDGGGVVLYAGGKFSAYGTDKGLTSNRVTAIAEDLDGNFWIGTADAGITRLRNGKVEHLSDEDGVVSVASIEASSDGSVWIGGGDGRLARYRNERFETFGTGNGVPAQHVTSILESTGGDIWVGTRGGGLLRYRDGSFRSFTIKDGLPSDHILALAEDAHGSIWIGTDHGGLSRLDIAGIATLSTQQGLSYDVVSALFSDRDGNVWVGTAGGGLNRLQKNQFLTYTTEQGLGHNFAYSIYEDPRGSLWIATDAGVTRVKDGRPETLTTKNGLSSNYAVTITGTRDGSIWIGTYGAGLNRYRDGAVKTFSTGDGLPGNDIYALYEDRVGDLWVGTKKGLARYSDGRFTAFTEGLSSLDITSITGDAEGGLWVGTFDRGLNLVHNGRVVSSYSSKDGLLSDKILTLYRDNDGALWIGTREGGLTRYKNNQFVSIAPRDGLYSDNIFQILEDGRGFLWMSSNRGLFRVKKQDLNNFADGLQTGITSIIYDRNDGLPAAEFSGGFQPAGLRSRDGRLWFPTNKGVVAVSGDPDSGASGSPRVVVERITADEKPIELKDPVRIRPGKSKFRFDYAAITFLAPERVQYRYMLEGVDEDWVYAGTRTEAYYTNLSPGRYRFNVQASDQDGAWSGQAAEVAFYFQPFFYETPLFQLLCIIAAALLILAAFRLRIQRLKVRQQELLELIDLHTNHLREEKEKTERALTETDRARSEAERQKEIAQRAREVIEQQADRLREMDRIKTRFFSNVSHEFRTPLTLTIGPLENVLAGVYGQIDTQAGRQLDLALRNARRLLRLINQLLDLSKLESGKMDLAVMRANIVPLVEGVVMSFTAFAEKRNLSLGFEAASEEVAFYFDPACLEKVMFNLISNAVKFTHQGGEILVAVNEGMARLDGRMQEAVLIHVRDNGIGIPEHELPYIFDRFHQVDGAVAHAEEGTGIGLSLVKELVELHHGTITVHSEPGNGSEFIVALPKGLAHFDGRATIVDSSGDGMRGDISRGPMMEMAVLDDEEEDPWDQFGIETVMPDTMVGRKPSILIVDDNPDLIDYVTMSLADDYAVTPATNGHDALEKAHRIEPDLIISDVMMPGMDGYSLCRELKASESLRHIPVIMLTARASQDDKIEGLEAGSDDYMAKPFSTRELRARVQNLLSTREQQRELANLNAELTGKNDELREASEMKSQLLNIAAHDMKNPLNAIREFAQILKSEFGDKSHAYDPLDLIHKSSDQMLQMVSSLLESSAIEEGKLVLELEPLNVNTLAASIVRRNSNLAEKKGQTLELVVASERCLVKADKNRLLEAMDNLVNNAVKYSPLNKTVWITVSRTASSVQFSVRDHGPGLTEDDKKKLFGKFQRLSAQPTGDETSTGLGLAIVKQIVEMHDGQVFVQSEPGRGSTFTIDLPILSEGDV